MLGHISRINCIITTLTGEHLLKDKSAIPCFLLLTRAYSNRGTLYSLWFIRPN